MIIYFTLFIFILICAKVNSVRTLVPQGITVDNTVNKPNKFYNFFIANYGIVVILFVLVAGLRSVNVGLDNYQYYSYFYGIQTNLKANFGINSFEYGYRILNVLIACIGLPYWVLQFVIAIITLTCFYFFINKFSKLKWLSWLSFLSLGLYAQMLNFNRQILAVSFILLAIISLREKKYVRYVFWVLLAFCFHKSAIIALSFLVFHFLKLSNKSLIFYVSATAALCILFKPLIKIAAKVFKVSYFSKYFAKKALFLGVIGAYDIIFIIALAVIFFVMYFMRKKLIVADDKTVEDNNFFLSLFLSVVLIRILGVAVNNITVVSRLTLFYFFSIIILLPNYFYYFCKKYSKLSKLAVVGVVLICAVYMYVLYAVKLSYGVVPYSVL